MVTEVSEATVRAGISQEKRCSVGLGAGRRVDQITGDAAPSLGTAPGCEGWKPVTLLAHQHILTPKANPDLLTRLHMVKQVPRTAT